MNTLVPATYDGPTPARRWAVAVPLTGVLDDTSALPEADCQAVASVVASGALPRRVVAVNERGQRIGQDHPHARLTDAEVDILLGLRDEGWGYRRLARKFEISRRAVVKICRGINRCQRAARHKTLPQ